MQAQLFSCFSSQEKQHFLFVVFPMKILLMKAFLMKALLMKAFLMNFLLMKAFLMNFLPMKIFLTKFPLMKLLLPGSDLQHMLPEGVFSFSLSYYSYSAEDILDTFSAIPISTSCITTAEPPKLINGSVIPVLGIVLVTTAILRIT